MLVDDRPRDPGATGYRLDRDRLEALLDDDRAAVTSSNCSRRAWAGSRWELGLEEAGHRCVCYVTESYTNVTSICVTKNGASKRVWRSIGMELGPGNPKIVDRRRRLRRDRYGDPSQTSRDRGLRRARARRRRRRRLALQHLSGLPLRRALAPLLVFLRAQPGLVADLLIPVRDPRLPRPLRRRATGSARTSAPTSRF